MPCLIHPFLECPVALLEDQREVPVSLEEVCDSQNEELKVPIWNENLLDTSAPRDLHMFHRVCEFLARVVVTSFLWSQMSFIREEPLR